MTNGNIPIIFVVKTTTFTRIKTVYPNAVTNIQIALRWFQVKTHNRLLTVSLVIFFPFLWKFRKHLGCVCVMYTHKKSIYKYANFTELSIMWDHCSCIYFHLSCLFHARTDFAMHSGKKWTKIDRLCLDFFDRNHSISRIIDQMSTPVSRLQPWMRELLQ